MVSGSQGGGKNWYIYPEKFHCTGVNAKYCHSVRHAYINVGFLMIAKHTIHYRLQQFLEPHHCGVSDVWQRFIFVTRWDCQHTGAIVWAHTEYITRAIIFIAEAAWRMHRHTGQHHPTKAAQIQLTPLKCDWKFLGTYPVLQPSPYGYGLNMALLVGKRQDFVGLKYCGRHLTRVAHDRRVAATCILYVPDFYSMMQRNWASSQS